MADRPNDLWIVSGDFNWVTKDSDRLDMASGNFSGHQDHEEEQHWQQHVATEGNLKELGQREFTFQSSSTRSRLDRVYTSHHTAEGGFRPQAHHLRLPPPKHCGPPADTS